MLQWRGGSRRKVTTSRKSTQKRQKQYFEQRRRQQQQQQTTDVQGFSDEMNICSEHQNNNRSLDILSLLNLSAVVQDHKLRCHSARGNSEGVAMPINSFVTKCPPTIPTDKVTLENPIEFEEARAAVECMMVNAESGNPSGCQMEIMYAKKVLSNSPDRNSTRNGDQTEQLKNASEHELFVFDLLGDDGLNDNFERNSVHEAHVAFAVEGLGKVETETPIHSPRQSGRNFSYGSSPPLKAARKPQSSENLNNLVYDLELEAVSAYDLELEVGDVIPDIDFSLSGNFLEVPFCSRGIANSFSKSRQKLSTAEECSQFISNASKMKNSFVGDEMFCCIEEENDDIWNAASNFQDGNFFDEDCDTAWKDRPLGMEGNSANYWNLGNHETLEFAFEEPYLQKIGVTEKVAGRFNISDSPTPYSKQQRTENDLDFLTLHRTWNPTVRRNCDTRDVTSQSKWSCHVTEDAGESLSLLSEESCSSSAARGKATKRSPSNSVARQNIRSNGSDIWSQVDKHNIENIYAKDRLHAKIDRNFLEGKKTNGPGKFTKRSPSISNPAYFSNTNFQNELGLDNSCLFEEGYISVDRDSGFSPLCHSSGTKERTSAGTKLLNEDLFGAPLPELRANVKSSFERSKHYLPDFMAYGRFSSEKLGQQYGHVHSYESPIFSPTGPGPRKPNFSMDSNVEVRSRGSSPISGSQGDTEVLQLSEEESVAKDEEERTEIQPTDCINFELQKDICNGSNDWHSQNGQPLEVSGSKDNCSYCKEAKGLTPDIENKKAASSPEQHPEEISSSVKIPDKFESIVHNIEYHNDAQTSLPLQNGSIVIQDSGPKGMRLQSKEQKTTLDPSHQQVMMLESYVLQLLCVQKVLKEASQQDTVKKIKKILQMRKNESQ